MKHRWAESSRTPHSTVRVCTRCDLRKITRHEFEGGREVHWTEFWRGTDRVRGEGTPACEPAEAEVAGTANLLVNRAELCAEMMTLAGHSKQVEELAMWTSAMHRDIDRTKKLIDEWHNQLPF